MKDFFICGNAYSESEIKQMSREDFCMEALRFLPQKLYKYFPNTTNEEGINYSSQALENNTVYLQTPMQFDDPYDCAITIDWLEFFMRRLTYYANECGCPVDHSWDYNKLVYELSLFLYTCINSGKSLEAIFRIKEDRNDHVDLTKHKFILLLQTVLHECQKDEAVWQKAFFRALNEEFSDTNKYLAGSFRVSCFTTSPYSMRMWAHYANNHKGFCIEYTAPPFNDQTKDIYSTLFPAIYSDHRTSVLDQCVSHLSMPRITDEILWDIYKYGLLSKSLVWKEQNEWRLISCDNLLSGDEHYNCRFFPISKVYLGNKMKPDDRKTVIEICNSKQIPYVGVTVHNDRYQMHDCERLCEDCPKLLSTQ